MKTPAPALIIGAAVLTLLGVSTAAYFVIQPKLAAALAGPQGPVLALVLAGSAIAAVAVALGSLLDH